MEYEFHPETARLSVTSHPEGNKRVEKFIVFFNFDERIHLVRRREETDPHDPDNLTSVKFEEGTSVSDVMNYTSEPFIQVHPGHVAYITYEQDGIVDVYKVSLTYVTGEPHTVEYYPNGDVLKKVWKLHSDFDFTQPIRIDYYKKSIGRTEQPIRNKSFFVSSPDGMYLNVETYSKDTGKLIERRLMDIKKNVTHSFGGKPAMIEYYDDGSVRSELWSNFGELHRDLGPALVEYDKDGKIEKMQWYQDGVRVQDLGDAISMRKRIKYEDESLMQTEWQAICQKGTLDDLVKFVKRYDIGITTEGKTKKELCADLSKHMDRVTNANSSEFKKCKNEQTLFSYEDLDTYYPDIYLLKTGSIYYCFTSLELKDVYDRGSNPYTNEKLTEEQLDDIRKWLNRSDPHIFRMNTEGYVHTEIGDVVDDILAELPFMQKMYPLSWSSEKIRRVGELMLPTVVPYLDRSNSRLEKLTILLEAMLQHNTNSEEKKREVERKLEGM